MSNQKYVPDGCWLRCDKGSAPTQLKVTHSPKASIYGDNIATEADKDFNVNVKPFGVCSVTQKACVMQPLYWDKCREGVKVNGLKLVVDEAHLLCAVGGRIEIFYSKADAMAGAGGAALGAGAGGARGAGYLDENFSALAREAALFDANSDPLPGTQTKGNFGEIRTTLDLKMRGYQMTSTTQAATLNDVTHQGLDLAARDPHGPTDIILDSKYSSSAGPPSMSNTSGSGRQMSDRWLQSPANNSRLEAGTSAADAQRINAKIAANQVAAATAPPTGPAPATGRPQSPGDLTRLAAKVGPDRGVTYYELDANGRNVQTLRPGETRPSINPVQVPAANVMGGSSRAANLVNSVSRSIQSNASVLTANEWLVTNAASVARVGRVVGRGLLVIGIITEGIAIYDAYQQDGGQVGQRTKKAIGSAAGALAGGLLGAKIGATIGAIGGPVGIIAGGIIGGIAGGLIGGFAGGEVGGWF